MDILHLLDRLETVLTSGSRIPLTGRTVVDEHECLDIVDQLRVAIPEEVKQARRTQNERERLLQEAEEQAARIVAHAQKQASDMVDSHEIVRAADEQARQTLDAVEAELLDRREGADRYAVETLSELEGQLAQLLGEVRNGIRSLSKGGRREDPDQ